MGGVSPEAGGGRVTRRAHLQLRRLTRVAVILTATLVAGLVTAIRYAPLAHAAASVFPGALERLCAEDVGARNFSDGDLSFDGRYALVVSQVPSRLFRKDRLTKEYVAVDVSPTGDTPNGSIGRGAMSDSGQAIAFLSSASNIAPGDTNALPDVFIRDMGAGQTRIIEQPSGRQGIGSPAVSANGRYLAFFTAAGDAPLDEARWEVHVHDRAVNRSTIVSNHLPSALELDSLDVSDNGQVLIATNSAFSGRDDDLLLFDLATSSLTVISRGVIDSRAIVGGGRGDISGDGSTIAFEARFDETSTWTVAAYDTATGALSAAVRDSSGMPLGAAFDPRLSHDGQRMVFSSAQVLPSGELRSGGSQSQIYVGDLTTNEIWIVSATAPESVSNGRFGFERSISGDGSTVLFSSDADNLDPGDDNTHIDVFLSGPRIGTAESCRTEAEVIEFANHRPTPGRTIVQEVNPVDVISVSGWNRHLQNVHGSDQTASAFRRFLLSMSVQPIVHGVDVCSTEDRLRVSSLRMHVDDLDVTPYMSVRTLADSSSRHCVTLEFRKFWNSGDHTIRVHASTLSGRTDSTQWTFSVETSYDRAGVALGLSKAVLELVLSAIRGPLGVAWTALESLVVPDPVFSN